MTSKLKILCLWPKRLYESKVSPVRRHAIAAIARRDDVELLLTGPEWPGYETQLTVQQNADRLMPGAQVVFSYKAGGHRLGPNLNGIRDVKALTVESWNECWWPDDLVSKELLANGTKLAICHHANDIPRLKLAADKGVKVVHIPHCAERAVFEGDGRERDIDVLVTGVRNKDFYPLRERWFDLVGSGRIKGNCHILSHPGYRRNSVDECEAVVREYAEMLKRSKVALVCSSRFRYPLAKITEAAMAGCCVIGDMPEQAPTGYDKMLIQVWPENNDPTLIGAVEVWLNGTFDRPLQASRSKKIALENYTQEHYAERFVSAVRAML